MIAIARFEVEGACEGAGLEEGAIRADYSGRGMYGDQCLGIVYGAPGELSAFLRALREELATSQDEDYADDVLERMESRQSGDSMGVNAIAYWPGVGVEGETAGTEGVAR